MQKVRSMHPVTEWHTNTALKGYGDIPDLPITKLDDESLASVWYQPSIWARIIFLFTGKITMSCLGYTHPPVGLHHGDYIVRKETK